MSIDTFCGLMHSMLRGVLCFVSLKEVAFVFGYRLISPRIDKSTSELMSRILYLASFAASVQFFSMSLFAEISVDCQRCFTRR